MLSVLGLALLLTVVLISSPSHLFSGVGLTFTGLIFYPPWKDSENQVGC